MVLEGSQGLPKGVQMVSDELAKWPDEGSTGGKTFAGSDFAKVKGSSGFGLPTAEVDEVVNDFRTKSVPLGSNESERIEVDAREFKFEFNKMKTS